MITNRYIHPHIQLCKDCTGCGETTTYPTWDVLHQHGETITCPTCEGSGRVLVSKKIEVTVVPFNQKKNK